jgi:hypothetical protein
MPNGVASRSFLPRHPVVFDPALSPFIIGYYLDCCAILIAVLLMTPSTSCG